jgi:hypothetical protein
MIITTGMHPAIAAAQADHIADLEDMGELSGCCFFSVRREWEEPDASVGESGGWFCKAEIIGTQIGTLVLSREDAEKALENMLAWMEKEVSERLTESVAYDDTPRGAALADAGDAAWKDGV